MPAAIDKDSLAAYTGVDLDVLGEAIAGAIRGTRKFGKAEHKGANDFLWAAHKTGRISLETLQACSERIANISAVRQELEKAGLLDVDMNAFTTHVEQAMERLSAAEIAKAKAA